MIGRILTVDLAPLDGPAFCRLGEWTLRRDPFGLTVVDPTEAPDAPDWASGAGFDVIDDDGTPLDAAGLAALITQEDEP